MILIILRLYNKKKLRDEIEIFKHQRLKGLAIKKNFFVC